MNLAKVLSSFKKKVLLIDADLGNADISNKLALFPNYTL
jgi:MinD-like ATPase involved in chromosome partitioning or flagellar assembly